MRSHGKTPSNIRNSLYTLRKRAQLLGPFTEVALLSAVNGMDLTLSSYWFYAGRALYDF
jgi:hypothetical protein